VSSRIFVSIWGVPSLLYLFAKTLLTRSVSCAARGYPFVMFRVALERDLM
jgi:hypothetical protein